MQKFDSGPVLQSNMLDVCAQVCWLLLAIKQDQPKNLYVAALRDRCERAALEGSWVRLPASEYHCGAIPLRIRLQLGNSRIEPFPNPVHQVLHPGEQYSQYHPHCRSCQGSRQSSEQCNVVCTDETTWPRIPYRLQLPASLPWLHELLRTLRRHAPSSPASGCIIKGCCAPNNPPAPCRQLRACLVLSMQPWIICISGAASCAL